MSGGDLHIANVGTGQHTWIWRDVSASAKDAKIPTVVTWCPLRRSDQPRLEKAEIKGDEKVVPVNGGRFEVQLSERMMVDCYDSVPPHEPRQVRRSLWGWLNGTKFEPYTEDESSLVEKAFGQLLETCNGFGEPESKQIGTGNLEQTVPLKSAGVQIRLKMVVTKNDSSWTWSTAPDAKCHWSLEAEEELPGASWLSSALSRRRTVRRGFGNVGLEEGESEEQALKHEAGDVLYILVHGVGEKIWSAQGTGQQAHVAQFRKNIHRRQLIEAGFMQTATGWQPPQVEEGQPTPEVPKFEVIRSSWWQTVHTGELDAQLERITLPRIPQAREIANYAIADAIFYMQLTHRETIMKAVAKFVDEAYRRYRRCHPNFNGKVVLLGHSLGGLILFELLRNGASKYGLEAQLSYTPAALYTFGSPIGIFLHCAGDVLEPGFALPGGTRMFNVFHPLDPIAYRLEPLFVPDLHKVPSEEVPYDSGTGNGQLGKVSSLWTWAVGKTQLDQQMRDLLAQLGLNAGQRVDWVLQEDYSLIKTPEIMHALPSHSGYFISPSVASFLHVQTLGIGSSAEKTDKADDKETLGMGSSAETADNADDKQGAADLDDTAQQSSLSSAPALSSGAAAAVTSFKDGPPENGALAKDSVIAEDESQLAPQEADDGDDSGVANGEVESIYRGTDPQPKRRTRVTRMPSTPSFDVSRMPPRQAVTGEMAAGDAIPESDQLLDASQDASAKPGVDEQQDGDAT